MSLNKKFMGIDYGTKRVGIALSDDGGSMAFPRTVLSNDKHLLSKVEALCKDGRGGRDRHGGVTELRAETKPAYGAHYSV